MKQFFMVNKDVRLINEQHDEWIDVSLEDLREAAEIDEDVKSVKLFTTLEDAQTAALDGVDFDEETDFFPIFVVNVADHVKGRKAKYSLDDGTKLDAISVKPEQIESVKSVYLDHIDPSYDDVHFPNNDAEEEQELESSSEEELEIAAQAEEEVEEELEVAAEAEAEEVEEELEASNDDKPEEPITASKPSRLAAMSQYVPSSKALVKNGLAIGATGAAYYFGNEAVVDLATKASVVVPEMLAASAALPLVVGTTARLATEVPELAAKGAKLAANSKVAAIASAKAAPVVERVAPYVPSTKNLVKNGFAVAAGALAFYFGNAEVVSLVAQTGLALPEVIAASALLPAGVVASARLVTELPEVTVKAASFVAERGSKLINSGKEWWNSRKPAAPKAPESQGAEVLKQRLASELGKKASKNAIVIENAGPTITTARDTKAAQAKQNQAKQPVVDLTKEQSKRNALH